jgi:hypothetical protein
VSQVERSQARLAWLLDARDRTWSSSDLRHTLRCRAPEAGAGAPVWIWQQKTQSPSASFGSSAVVGSFVPSSMASRRRREPVALRPRLWPGVLFSRSGARIGRGTGAVNRCGGATLLAGRTGSDREAPKSEQEPLTRLAPRQFRGRSDPFSGTTRQSGHLRWVAPSC